MLAANSNETIEREMLSSNSNEIAVDDREARAKLAANSNETIEND
jgi:hypothetical protein